MYDYTLPYIGYLDIEKLESARKVAKDLEKYRTPGFLLQSEQSYVDRCLQELLSICRQYTVGKTNRLSLALYIADMRVCGYPIDEYEIPNAGLEAFDIPKYNETFWLCGGRSKELLAVIENYQKANTREDVADEIKKFEAIQENYHFLRHNIGKMDEGEIGIIMV